MCRSKDDSHRLNLWAKETVQFAGESGFDDFYRMQEDYYAETLAYVSSCDFDTWISYIESYFMEVFP